ncbi:dienelactone hydrolase family protein [Asticcacaulis sp. EMRT-3]|uniref:carboxylesterase family protein n=1 Tax=Asticcacaulis sp. EMRT-3 TaxID=3040349 RepID=UPI0024AF2525|nr:dienelactone hydrolase family protein [Asticcacaulis sp. EMRT-3]MDI7773842.1 dienelactone hydrolase family protein [Asticcacaulis sp. EMRT-3]
MNCRRAVSYLLPLLLAMSLNACVSIPKILYDTSQTRPLSLTLKDGTVQRYMEYVPPSARPGKKLPLIVFLHGSGEAGDDTYAVLANGPWHYADSHPDFPFIILAPQEDHDAEWSPEELNDWLVQAEKTVPVDRRRVYLTGLSRGGQGTWDFAMRYPQHFAAIAPVSGYSDVNQPCRLKGVAVWAFHGADDGIVPIGKEKAVVAAAKACGVDIHYTIYPGVGHFIWERTYNDPDLYSWFLEHRRPLFRLPGLTHLSGFARLHELRRAPSGG